jgi:hypothetical protein
MWKFFYRLVSFAKRILGLQKVYFEDHVISEKRYLKILKESAFKEQSKTIRRNKAI